MRKSMTRVLLLALILALLCVGAMAAGDKDTTTIKSTADGCTVTPLDVNGEQLTAKEDGHFEDVAKFKLEYTAEAGEQLVMLLLSESENAVPTANNIYYIDQQSQNADGTCTFTIYPKQLTSGTYRLLVASKTSETAATIKYEAAYVLGDVTGDGKVTAPDATAVLRHAAGKVLLTGKFLLAGDVTGDGKVTAPDATKILRFAAGKIETFD